MKKIITVVTLAFLGSIAAPAFAADQPKSPDECKKVYEGDQAKIDACIKSLEKK